MALNKAKFENAVLQLVDLLGGEIRGKKKLAKLLYFVDFDFFEKEQKSITGAMYIALPMGPVPAKMERVLKSLVQEEKIVVNSIGGGAGFMPTEVYVAKSKPDLTAFDRNELAMLQRVAKKYGHLNGKQLEDLTHAEAPYIGTELTKEIVYELASYRGTDFSEDA